MTRQARRRLTLASAGCLLLGFVGLNVMAYRHAYAMMHFTNTGMRTAQAEELSLAQKIKVLATGINVPRPACNADKGGLGPQTVSLKIKCDDGPTLGAWFCPGAATNILVIMFHGYTGEKSSLLEPARAFQELGCSVGWWISGALANQANLTVRSATKSRWTLQLLFISLKRIFRMRRRSCSDNPWEPPLC